MHSLWVDSVYDKCIHFDTEMSRSCRTDVLIIGGGLAGVLLAHRLTAMGVDCILVEGGRLGKGTTGHTTAKVTAQHKCIYADLIDKYGLEQASQYYHMNEKALAAYRALSKQHDFHFEEKNAYVYSIDNRKKLEKEARAYQRIGIPFHMKEQTTLPFEVAGALGMEKQAQINPLELLMGLAADVEIYENTFVHDVDVKRVVTNHGIIKAEYVVMATHYPLVNVPGLFFMKMYQHRSYVVALQNGPDVGGMYLDEKETGFSFRNYEDKLLLGGGSHRTGYKGGGYAELRDFAGKAYPLAKEVYAWAAQDCMTLDGMPYIGVHRKSTPNIYVATGFNKWGMTGSMAAAMVLTDLIVHGKSMYSALISPQRSMLHAQLLGNTLAAIYGYASFGKRCPHMGCALKWNKIEKTWDCPCHGSRFDKAGHVIENPAKKGLPSGE